MKTIAMYLPQYHRVPENDEWWGEGFTDWRAMENAKPLFAGHKQPKKVLNNYQYDLMDRSALEWQEKLMKKHGIYGLCFYHYYFKDGRKILEKPAEKLLKWKEIDIPFCFSWANESWGRSWSNIRNQNVWASAFEIEEVHIGDGILLEQDYGNKEEWAEHFKYLLPFLKDVRYIKKENKPIILIYKQEDIHCLESMRKVWDEIAIENGFDGVYLIGNYHDGMEKTVVDATLVMEPGATIDRAFPARYADKNRMEVARYIPYEKMCQESLKWKAPLTEKIYYGGFSNYDDTPRRGNAGTVIYNDTPEKFKVYLADLYAKNAACNNEFVFINAWNEWGEGMHLEPDEEFGEGFLEAIRYAEKHYLEEIYKYNSFQETKEPDMNKKQVARYKLEVDVLSNLLTMQEKHISVAEWLSQHNYKRVGIYGLGVLGRHLLEQLQQHNFDYLCCIDRNAKGLNLDIPVFTPDQMPELELLIVTNVHIFNEIFEDLRRESTEIVSLETIIRKAFAESLIA